MNEKIDEFGQTKGIQRYSLKIMINTVKVYNKIKRILEQNNILLACTIGMNVLIAFVL